MGQLVATMMLALAAASSAADPLLDAVKASGGTLCFTRVYDNAWLKAHRGQTVRQVTLAFSSSDRLPDGATLRLKIEGRGAPLYALGECTWMAEGLNRGVQDNVLMSSFKPTKGVGCHLYVDASLVSAEEGGDYPVDWRDGRTIELHLDDLLASWRSTDVRRHARFAPLAKGDRVFRLNRAPAAACRDLVRTFVPGGPG